MFTNGYHPQAAMSWSPASACHGNYMYPYSNAYMPVNLQWPNSTITGYGANSAYSLWSSPPHGQSNPAPAQNVQHQHQVFSRPRSARPPSGSHQNVNQTHVSKISSPQCSRTAQIPAPPPEDQAERSLKRKLSTMLREEQLQLLNSKTGEWRVTCGEREWKVHSFIVEPRCQFFKAAVKFKQDEKEKMIDMSDDDPEAVDVLLQFLYARNSGDIGTMAPFTDSPAQTLANIAIIADKYNEHCLLEQAEIEIFRFVRTSQYLGLEDAPSRACDAIRALAKLHEHGTVSKPLQRAQLIMLKFLKDTGQLKIMQGDVLEVFEEEVTANPGLATMMVKFLSGGTFQADSQRQKEKEKEKESAEVIDLREG